MDAKRNSDLKIRKFVLFVLLFTPCLFLLLSACASVKESRRNHRAIKETEDAYEQARVQAGVEDTRLIENAYEEIREKALGEDTRLVEKYASQYRNDNYDSFVILCILREDSLTIVESSMPVLETVRRRIRDGKAPMVSFYGYRLKSWDKYIPSMEAASKMEDYFKKRGLLSNIRKRVTSEAIIKKIELPPSTKYEKYNANAAVDIWLPKIKWELFY